MKRTPAVGNGASLPVRQDSAVLGLSGVVDDSTTRIGGSELSDASDNAKGGDSKHQTLRKEERKVSEISKGALNA